MIVVQVNVPRFDTSYNFKLDEDTPIGLLLEDMVSVICQKERRKAELNSSGFVLVNLMSQSFLTQNLTLYENGVKSGDVLELI